MARTLRTESEWIAWCLTVGFGAEKSDWSPSAPPHQRRPEQATPLRTNRRATARGISLRRRSEYGVCISCPVLQQFVDYRPRLPSYAHRTSAHATLRRNDSPRPELPALWPAADARVYANRQGEYCGARSVRRITPTLRAHARREFHSRVRLRLLKAGVLFAQFSCSVSAGLRNSERISSNA